MRKQLHWFWEWRICIAKNLEVLPCKKLLYVYVIKMYKMKRNKIKLILVLKALIVKQNDDIYWNLSHIIMKS
jgi:hypothetical protein